MEDVVIIGAGVAGPFLAKKLMTFGIQPIIIEKSRKIPIKDSGIVSTRFLNHFPRYLIDKDIKRMEIISPSGMKFVLGSETPFSYILKRRQFTMHLRKGCKIKYETANSVIYEKGYAIVETSENTYKTKIVVGADGVNSIVKKSANIKSPTPVLGMFCQNKPKKGSVKVHMNKYYSPDYFAWEIPQNGEHGLITGIRPSEYLEYFEKKIGLEKKEVIAHPISIGFNKSYADRTILIGDAASQVKPVTGGGIIFSLIAAKHAADIIRNSLGWEDYSASFLKQYEKRWKQELGSEIRKQLLFRKVYRNMTNQQIDKLFKEFGPSVEKLKDFDYDKLSGSWKSLPKLKLIKHLLLNVKHMI